YRVEASPVEGDATALVESAGLRLDVNDPRGPETVLRGEGAGDELHALHEARVELEAEPGDALGEKHVVDPVLEVRVLAAHVQVAVGCGVLGDARRAQEDLIERGVLALGKVENLRLIHDERGGPQAGKYGLA